ncbi:MAG: DUF2851 family protein [Bacteroidales bacterium]|jgi:hypothetical protein|nr:DUF2851 family protein [Bacteroidales bacterium]
MKEEFLHFLWKYGLYDSHQLCDSHGNAITVINPGEYNRDAGPDFFNARISVAGTVWAGNVEIHAKSSHFNVHGHHTNPAYDNVVLHVVAENDKRIYNSKGEELLTAVLAFDMSLTEKYSCLLNTPSAIACQDDIGSVDKIFQRNWFEALAIERLEEKSVSILGIFSETGNNWEETFYRVLSRYFGFSVNAEPFERLSRRLPLNIIRKHADSRFQIEALLYGTAGLLSEGLFKDNHNDAYYNRLVREYKILSAKYTLQPLDGWIWKFARLRPPNFPTVRISQLAGLLAGSGGLFSRIIEAEGVGELAELFRPQASEYWDSHYTFGAAGKTRAKRAGAQTAGIILINSVIPVLYSYGKVRGMASCIEKAERFLEDIKAEDNAVIRDWINAGITPDSALMSQALLQLRNCYCRKKRCLDCRIGFKLISSGAKMKEQNTLLLEP